MGCSINSTSTAFKASLERYVQHQNTVYNTQGTTFLRPDVRVAQMMLGRFPYYASISIVLEGLLCHEHMPG
jgi:hypothetical protein